VLREGRLEQVASPSDLYDRPATVFVASFVGTMNRVPATAVSGGAELLGLRRPVTGDVPSGGPVVALVRPEALTVTADDAGPGRVVTRTFSGAITRLAVALPDRTEVQVDLASADSQDLTPGTAVRVGLAERPVLLAPAEPE
jgi:putative spermidine/putrescine transport system ATP-binding protein